MECLAYCGKVHRFRGAAGRCPPDSVVFFNSGNESTLGRLLDLVDAWRWQKKIGVINLKARLYAATIERGLPKPAEPSMGGPRCLALREGCRRDVLTNWDQSPA
jgi:hypothetical protein